MTKPPREFHQESSVLTVIQSKAGSEQPARPSATGEADLGVSLEVTLQEVNFWAYPEGQRSEVRGQVCMLEQLDDSTLPNHQDPQ